MTRLEKILAGNDPIDYPEDVARLKAHIPELATLSDDLVDTLYGDWSDEVYCAGWMCLDSVDLDDFAAWLREEVPE